MSLNAYHEQVPERWLVRQVSPRRDIHTHEEFRNVVGFTVRSKNASRNGWRSHLHRNSLRLPIIDESFDFRSSLLPQYMRRDNGDGLFRRVNRYHIVLLAI